MSNTRIPARVEVSHMKARGKNGTADVMQSLKSELVVFQNNPGDVSFSAKARAEFNGYKHEATAYITLEGEDAKTLVRNLAERLGMKVAE